MQCPHCQAVNEEDDHRCRSCWRLLPTLAVAAPASGAAFRSENDKPESPESKAPVAEIPVPAKPVVPVREPPRSHAAPPMRRVRAAAIDTGIVLLGFGIFAATASFSGSAFGGGYSRWITLAVSLILLSLLYGLLWAVAMRETAGMAWMRLRLVTFDGSRLDARSRAIRFVSVWLSWFSAGLGWLWALTDREDMALHDRLSKTYPAEKND